MASLLVSLESLRQALSSPGAPASIAAHGLAPDLAALDASLAGTAARLKDLSKDFARGASGSGPASGGTGGVGAGAGGAGAGGPPDAALRAAAAAARAIKGAAAAAAVKSASPPGFPALEAANAPGAPGAAAMPEDYIEGSPYPTLYVPCWADVVLELCWLSPLHDKGVCL